jgi:hypothetical protein
MNCHVRVILECKTKDKYRTPQIPFLLIISDSRERVRLGLGPPPVDHLVGGKTRPSMQLYTRPMCVWGGGGLQRPSSRPRSKSLLIAVS